MLFMIGTAFANSLPSSPRLSVLTLINFLIGYQMKSLKIAATIAVLGLSQAAQANLVVNGGFEIPNQAAGTWSIYTSIDGWNPNPNIEIRNAVVGNAAEGNNYAELDTTGNSAISQTLTTVVGAMYEISFQYSPRIDVPLASNGIAVYFDNALVGTANGSGSSTHNWQLYSYFATTNSVSSLLEFRAVGTSDSLGGSLDDVKVNAVPLPGTVALLGLGLVAFAARRRAAK
jgi:PEP-CTERM motif